MEALLLVGVFALFVLALGGDGHQPLPKAPQVIYVVSEPRKAERGQGGGGFLLLLALCAIALLATSMP